MRVIRADVLGMCFGVRDSLAMIDEIAEPHAVTIHGELVHNEVVQLRLEARGFAMRSELDAETVPAGNARGLDHGATESATASGTASSPPARSSSTPPVRW